MCGITGLFDYGSSYNAQKFGKELERMTSALTHRGPDDAGIWQDDDVAFGLGHRRLSIIDLSTSGHQPMISASQRYIIAYNGEVYNFQHLKKSLEQSGHSFSGTSDTEVLLAAIEEWGLEKALEKSSGMFAFALWDRQKKTLFLARDRIGKKPLYFGNINGQFILCSELKALHALKDVKPEIDRDSLALFMQHNYVPSPWSIYKGIYKLPPGHFTTLPLTQTQNWSEKDFFASIKPYWTINESADHGLSHPIETGLDEGIDLLQSTLSEAVQQRMIADVPLGAFLSGGIDSSLVVSLMAEHSALPPKTFCIGYNEEAYNEAKHAKKIAKHLGAEHTELYLKPSDALSVLDDLSSIYDEPFSDSSQIPTLFVSKLAREHVTVALSGDGGDELFYGYARYFEAQNLKNKTSLAPAFLRKIAGGCLNRLSADTWSNLTAGKSGHRIHALGDFLSLHSSEEQYEFLISHWKNPYELVPGSKPRDRHFSSYTTDQDQDFSSLMMRYDQLNYLPEDNLVKVDRASMAHSLEIRCPLLDHKVIELAWKIPMHMKCKDGQGKYILHRLLERYLPKELFDRPKQGFAVPVAEWLRGPLKEWGEALLNEDRLAREGLLNPKLVRQRWDEHQSGKHDWHPRLWNVLMFQAWYERWHKS